MVSGQAASVDGAPHAAGWKGVLLLLFAVGWGANHFAPLLLVYRKRLALDAAAPALLFGMYALGLVPSLLLAGPLSDRYGRRSVVLPSAVIAGLASAVLGLAGASFNGLLFGRLLYGLGAGGVMSAGAAWAIELSHAVPPGVGPRRVTIALSSGFGLGPLVSGLLAQFVPAPTVVPFATHVLILVSALFVAWRSPAIARRGLQRVRQPLSRAAWRHFLRGVAPMAPFVFGFPSIAFAALPSMLDGALGRAPTAYTGMLCALTLAAGVIAQPITRRFEPAFSARLGLVTGAGGILLGALAVILQAPALLLVVAPILGAAYGVCMTAGLHAVQSLAPPDLRGGITGLYYVLTYLGFAAPYLLLFATRSVAPAVALALTAGLAVTAAAVLPRSRPRTPEDKPGVGTAHRT